MAWYRCVGGAGGSLKLRTASGRIATFSTNMVEAFKSLKSEINPVQDLHGYTKPWSGGAGKNKAHVTATSQTINDVAYTVATDGKVTANGTANGASILDLGTITLIGGTSYILSGCPSGGMGSTYALFLRGSGSFAQKIDFGGGNSFTVTDTVTTTLSLIVYNGYTASNLKFEPMVRLSSTSADFEPYSNICPISGVSSLNITRTGKNLLDFNPVTVTTQSRIVDNFTLKAGTYTVAFDIKNTTSISGYYQVRVGTTSIGGVNFGANYNSRLSVTFTLSAESTINIVVSGATSGYSYQFSNGQIEQGSTATDYIPYNGQTVTVNFGQTVYGGVAGVTGGSVEVTHDIVDLGSLSWVKISMGGGRSGFRATIPTMALTPAANTKINAICEGYEIKNGNDVYLGNVGLAGWGVGTHDIAVYDDTLESGDATAFKTAMNGIELVYELATPIEITTTPENLTAIVGQNNVYSDTNGDTEVKYLYRE